MRLSEAMRLGAMLKPQGTLNLVREGKTCALGAAADAVGLLDVGSEAACFDALCERWPILVKDVLNPNGTWVDQLKSIVWTLNDSLGWTREAIADWIAKLEPPEAPPAIERTPDEAYAWVQTTNAARAD